MQYSYWYVSHGETTIGSGWAKSRAGAADSAAKAINAAPSDLFSEEIAQTEIQIMVRSFENASE